MSIMKRFLLLFMIAHLVSGCAHVVSRELRDRADKGIPAAALFSDPDAYKGRLVILGGTVINTTPTDKGTYIEVLQKPLDRLERPEDTDFTYGRFLILYEGYLEPTIYSRGRAITVAGDLVGSTVRRLDEMQYRYPLIRSRELYLLEPRRPLPLWIGIGVGATF